MCLWLKEVFQQETGQKRAKIETFFTERKAVKTAFLGAVRKPSDGSFFSPSPPPARLGFPNGKLETAAKAERKASTARHRALETQRGHLGSCRRVDAD